MRLDLRGAKRVRGETWDIKKTAKRNPAKKNNKKLGLRLNYFPLFVYLLIFCFNLIFFGVL